MSNFEWVLPVLVSLLTSQCSVLHSFGFWLFANCDFLLRLSTTSKPAFDRFSVVLLVFVPENILLWKVGVF